MKTLEEREFRVFDLFQNRWGLVTAGDPQRFNACTVSWGSLGTLWERPGHEPSVVTVYIHPARYTNEFLRKSEFFTVSFFPEEYKKALAYLGSHSGRREDKIAASGLTPIPFGGSVGYREAELSFLCRKIYQHEFSKEDLSSDVLEHYTSNPRAFPPDENGEWHAHWMFIGEILDVADR